LAQYFVNFEQLSDEEAYDTIMSGLDECNKLKALILSQQESGTI
jgi:hypothetical protein